jgi:hypothetical protein
MMDETARRLERRAVSRFSHQTSVIPRGACGAVAHDHGGQCAADRLPESQTVHPDLSPKRARRGAAATLLATLLLLAACGGEEKPRAGTGAPLACAEGSGAGEWTGVFAEVPGTGEDPGVLGPVAGLAADGGVLLALDVERDAVLVLDSALRRSGAFGRKGKGPGELDAGGATLFPAPGGSKDWLAGRGDSVIVYDGTRLSVFDGNGRFQRYLVREPMEIGMSPALHRIRLVDGELLFAAGGHDPMSRAKPGKPARWELRRYAGSGTESLLSLDLPDLPKHGGVPFSGPGQAQAVWDANRACAVASDGSSPFVVVRELASGRVDTLRVSLPPSPPPGDDQELRELMKQMGQNRGPIPPATAPMRVRDLAIAPDGMIWLLPRTGARPAVGPVEVLMIDPRTGGVRRDTVPAFPRAFGEPGTYYGVTRNGDDVQRIVRVRAAGGAAAPGAATPR